MSNQQAGMDPYSSAASSRDLWSEESDIEAALKRSPYCMSLIGFYIKWANFQKKEKK